MPDYGSVTQTVTLRLLCVSVAPDGRRCLESASFTGSERGAAEPAAYAAGWKVDQSQTVARCPACTAAGRLFGSLEMDQR